MFYVVEHENILSL